MFDRWRQERELHRQFRVGDAVRVRADAYMYAGLGHGPLSTHVGEQGTVVSVGKRFADDYPVRVALNEGDTTGCGFLAEELERI